MYGYLNFFVLIPSFFTTPVGRGAVLPLRACSCAPLQQPLNLPPSMLFQRKQVGNAGSQTHPTLTGRLPFQNAVDAVGTAIQFLIDTRFLTAGIRDRRRCCG